MTSSIATTMNASMRQPDLGTLVGGGLTLPGNVPGEERIEVSPSRLPLACATVADRLDARLVTMVGEDDRLASNAFRLSYVFAPARGGWVTIETALGSRDPSFPSVTPSVPAANWYEREVRDLLGIEPLDHPDPRRLVLHDDWPQGVYPLRKDFDPSMPVPREPQEPHRFHTLHGDGIVEIPA